MYLINMCFQSMLCFCISGFTVESSRLMCAKNKIIVKFTFKSHDVCTTHQVSGFRKKHVYKNQTRVGNQTRVVFWGVLGFIGFFWTQSASGCQINMEREMIKRRLIVILKNNG